MFGSLFLLEEVLKATLMSLQRLSEIGNITWNYCHWTLMSLALHNLAMLQHFEI